MEILAVLHDENVGNGASVPCEQWWRRTAARAVVLNSNSEVAIIAVPTLRYHKIPGGGVEDGEDILFALKREALEEAGCDIEIIDELGEVHEYVSRQKRLQVSHCFLVKAVRQGTPSFTAEERAKGFSVCWFDLDEAIRLMQDDRPDDYTAKFMSARDLLILKRAKEKLL